MRVNLLPWREEQRRRRQQGFLLAVCVAALAGGIVVYSAKLTVQARLAEQRARNDMIRGEIAGLDRRVEEIEFLEARKNRLLARMRVIVESARLTGASAAGESPARRRRLATTLTPSHGPPFARMGVKR